VVLNTARRGSSLKFLFSLLVATLTIAACSDVVTVDTAKVTRKPLIVPILADGSLEPPPGGEIRASESGIVARILVGEGQSVARGTALVQLSDPELEQRVFASRNEMLQLDEEERRTAEELTQQRQERDRLRSIAEADQRLLRAGAITAQQQSADAFAARQADDRVRQLESQVASLKTRRSVAADSARELERRLSVLTIRAPIDGVTYNLPRMAGEPIVPGQVVGIVADPRHLRVRARVDAPDLPRIRPGQRLIVTFDGLPNRSWQGVVLLVPPGVRQFGGREVAEVIGELSDDTAALPPNASVNVQIIIGEKPSALVIPRGALMRDGARRFVFRFVGGKARRTPIEVGLIGPNEVEVLGGLSEGDSVILPGSAPLRDGESVQVSS